MRWKARPKEQIGQQRVITRFLFLPRTVEGETRWLEVAKIRQAVALSYDRQIYWEDMEWA